MPEYKHIQEPQDIVLNQDNEIDQILGNPPSWILKWGITLILLIVLLFGALAWLIKYPDIIAAKVVLVTQNPVIPVVARTSGAIEHLLVTNDQEVQKGTLLAVLDNTASYHDVQMLDSFLLDAIETIEQSKEIAPLPSSTLQLGSLQAPYASLVQQLSTSLYFAQQQDTWQKVRSLEAQQAHIRELNTNLKTQQTTLAQEVELARKDFTRNKKLHQEGVIADIELERIEAFYLQSKRQLQTTQNSIISNQITREQLATQILDLMQERQNTSSEQQRGILASIDALRGEIKTWEQTYLIKAPIDGQVVLSKVWSEKQFVQVNEELFSLMPSYQKNKILGRAQLPLANSGKVAIGQTVNIQLDGFPYQEYGVVKGKVAHISLVPTSSEAESSRAYMVEIDVPSDLCTTYGKKLPFRQSMVGTANIVTEDRRILVRVIDQLNEVVSVK